MNEKELNITFRWNADVSNLLPTEINRIVGSCAEQLNKAVGKPIATAAYEFQGKHHNVPLGEKVPSGAN